MLAENLDVLYPIKEQYLTYFSGTLRKAGLHAVVGKVAGGGEVEVLRAGCQDRHQLPQKGEAGLFSFCWLGYHIE